MAKGVLAEVRGDWDFLAKQCMLPSPSHTCCCWWCTQSKDTLEDRNEEARTSDEFFKWCEDTAVHDVCALFTLPGASTSIILMDWMHLVELGVGQDLVGNICWECLRRPGTLTGGSIPVRLKALNDLLKAYNSEHKPFNPVQRLTKGMVKSEGGQPKLKCKTSECRGLQPWAVQLAKLLLANHGTERYLRIVACADALVACSQAVDSRVFSVAELQRTADLFLDHYAWLHKHCTVEGEDIAGPSKENRSKRHKLGERNQLRKTEKGEEHRGGGEERRREEDDTGWERERERQTETETERDRDR